MRAAMWMWFGAAALVGCSGGSDDDDTGEMPMETGMVMGCEGEFDMFMSSFAVDGASDSVNFAFVSASPSPPDEGVNDWRLALTFVEGGAPVEGWVVTLEPFMTAHGHGTTPATFTGAEVAGAPGQYDLTGFDLIMPGVWQFTISAAPGSKSTDRPDSAVFSFCIEG